MSHLRVFLLGSPRVEYNGKALKIPQHKALALLAYLALTPGAHSREQLATLFWPDVAPQRALAYLRMALWQLKKTPIANFLDAERTAVGLQEADALWVDVLHVQRCLTTCQTHGHAKDEVCAACIPLLTDMAETCEGDFMAGFTLKDSVEFDDWQSFQATTLREQLSSGLERLVLWHSEHGVYRQAITYAQSRVALDPLHETARQQLMQVYALDRQYNLAIRQYQDYVKVLERELGISPAEETTALYKKIRARQALSTLEPPATPLPVINDPLPVPSPLAGERRIVTALVAGIKGAAPDAQGGTLRTEIAERILQLLSSKIRHYGGVLDRCRQDGLVAFFGMPTAHENAPECAVLAALAMQEALRRAAGLSEALSLHIGINTEDVVTVAGDGERQPHEETVRGMLLTLATELAAAAAPGSILVAESTYRQVASLFTWSLGAEQIPEGHEPATGFRPLAYKRLPNKGRGIEGMQSSLVGRDVEFNTLRKTIARLRDGMGGIVIVVGEAGIGKSRLIAELKSQIESSKQKAKEASAGSETPREELQPAWIEGRCLSYAVNDAYQMWLDMLRSWLEVTPDADPAVVCAILRRKLNETCPDAAGETYPFLVQLLSLPQDAEVAAYLQGIDAEGLHVLTFRAIETLVENVARRRSLIIVCEDLHWADPTSLALLEHLLPLTDRVAVLLLCVMRPMTDHACWRIKELAARDFSHRHTDLSLEALSYDQSTALIRNLLLMEALPACLRHRILAHAEGNPFFLEEILRSLIEANVIARDGAAGCWYATREISTLAIPGTLQGVLVARIDRLAPPARHVLQLAAVIGHTFSWRILESVAEPMSAADLESHLITLQRAKLIHQQARLPEREYAFEHVLTQEAAYGRLSKRERHAIHRRAAEALEKLCPERIKEQPGLLAHHWEQAGDARRAALYLRRAGEQASAQFANVEAVDYLSRALALLPETNIAGRYDVLAKREAIYDLLGRREAQQQDLSALAVLASALDTDRPQAGHSRQAEIALRQSRCAHRLGQNTVALAAARKAIQSARATQQDIAVEASAYREWGRALWHLGKESEALPLLERALALSRQAALPQVEIEVLHSLGKLSHLLGNLAQAQFYWGLELKLCQKTGNRRSEGEACRDVGAALYYQGRRKEALPYFDQSLIICSATGDRRNAAWAMTLLGENYWAQGHDVEGELYAGQALALFREINEPEGLLRVLSSLCSMARDKGRYGKALDYLKQAAQLNREIGDRINEGWALTLFDETHWGQGCFDEGEIYTEQALALFQEIKAPQGRLSALCLLYSMAQDKGQYDKAMTYLTQAVQLSRENGDRVARSAFLRVFSSLLRDQGNYSQARLYLEQALQISRETGSRLEEGWNLWFGGRLSFLLGDYPHAMAATEESLHIAREIQDEHLSSDSLRLLGLISHQRGEDETAQWYGRQALHSASAENDNNYLQIWAWYILGHAAEGLHHPQDAVYAYTQAMEKLEIVMIKTGYTQVLSTEARAGLARAILAQGDVSLALTHVAQILNFLREHPSLSAAFEPLLVYQTCYRVLHAGADPRAPEVLRTAYTLIREQAARIADTSLRRSYLENVPHHREIIAEWEHRAVDSLAV
ncbi:MAG: tetratricopeptide repeat protein [Anaerolineae bacterium]|nr:tetratricopeptide repeat protein [Anaerolineae bacterium]